MDDALRMLAAWDAGHPVGVLRLSSGGPAQEQSAHILAFELIRDAAGLPLPATPQEWGTWCQDALRRVEALPGVDLPLGLVTTVKAYVLHLLRGGWEPLASGAPSMNHITVSRTLPSLDAPVSPKTVAAAKEHDRLAAWIVAEIPEEIRGDTPDPSATGVAIRLLADWKQARRVPTPRAPEPGPAVAELLQDLEDRMGDRLEEALGTALAPLVARLNALEGGLPKPGKARPAVEAGPANAGPVVLTEPSARGPAVVEGKRPTGKTSFPETEAAPRGRQR